MEKQRHNADNKGEVTAMEAWQRQKGRAGHFSEAEKAAVERVRRSGSDTTSVVTWRYLRAKGKLPKELEQRDDQALRQHAVKRQREGQGEQAAAAKRQTVEEDGGAVVLVKVRMPPPPPPVPTASRAGAAVSKVPVLSVQLYETVVAVERAKREVAATTKRLEEVKAQSQQLLQVRREAVAAHSRARKQLEEVSAAAEAATAAWRKRTADVGRFREMVARQAGTGDAEAEKWLKETMALQQRMTGGPGRVRAARAEVERKQIVQRRKEEEEAARHAEHTALTASLARRTSRLEGAQAHLRRLEEQCGSTADMCALLLEGAKRAAKQSR